MYNILRKTVNLSEININYPCQLFKFCGSWSRVVNLLMPNVNCSDHTARLASKVTFYIFIQQI